MLAEVPEADQRPRRVTILGATGSIGQSTLDVIARHPDRFCAYALTAFSRMDVLATSAAASNAAVVVVPDDDASARFAQQWASVGAGKPIPEIRVGAQALADTAADAETDVVMAAIVGAAGLPGALAAAAAGKRVLLANKEALVVAGGLFMETARRYGAELLPIDSEHNAIFQCLPQRSDALAGEGVPATVRRLILTASGGPFRERAIDTLRDVTPDEACAHPNWSMGRKISVDSATMLNKGLEVIEAHWLFGVPADRISVLIHPQSAVHSMVEYEDGSTLAQLGQPDMRTPIAYGLGFPERIESGVGLLDLAKLGRLDFQEPDLTRFPGLRLAFDALAAGQGACIALNAANEVAVDAFLQGKLRFTDIPAVIEEVLAQVDAVDTAGTPTLDALLAADARMRALAEQFAARRPRTP
ncbi:1-deoxy-D-xylulose-5-phosphate reductoisomerase [Pigmentiphaga aceris]|uniref:1-deoxy-D-xylulose 5-phosphate reductoisomerase n=1 Tax=Pigmentiphaga aceris TaxID=1940612 RepID=A0A5C0B3F6_9BURK|nr:1-deoxy-D-xylulose-5-phosphate reductoisomerase [Pigmentiphaga aceris]